jgi:hypothetical protein
MSEKSEQKKEGARCKRCHIIEKCLTEESIIRAKYLFRAQELGGQ